MVTQRDPDLPFPSRSEYQRKLREAEAAAQEAQRQQQPAQNSVELSAVGSSSSMTDGGVRQAPQHNSAGHDEEDRQAEQAAYEAALQAVEGVHKRLEQEANQTDVRDAHVGAPGSTSPQENPPVVQGSTDTFILEETRPYPPAALGKGYSSIPRASHSVPPAAVFWEEAKESPLAETELSAQVPSFEEVPPSHAPHPDSVSVDRHSNPPGTFAQQVPAETTGMRSRRLESERAKTKKRRMWRRIRTVVIILFVLALIGGAVWLAWTQISGGASIESSDDYVGSGHGETQITVFQGESGADIGEKLVNAGVVKSLAAFIRAFEGSQASSAIWPGTYTLRLEMSAADAVAALLDDANRSDNTVTVIPGQTVNQVMKKIVEVTDMTEEDVNAALADPKALGLPDVAGGNIEGWLAPGSYEVSADETAQSMLSQMIAARVKQLDDLQVPEADRQSVLIKASILEREVNIDEDLPKVARVIENRLADPTGETSGRLQMDSTVLYGVGKTGGIPTAEDLANDNPYNTYLHQGLPAAPIAQPAIEAIEAMLKPADGPWLYFVTVDLDTGETRFAATSEEHLANKALLDAYCAANKSKCEQ